MSDFKFKLGFVGSGNMAQAIVHGVLSSGMLAKSDIVMSNTSGNSPIDGVECTVDNGYVAANSEYLVLAVKPQVFKSIAASLRPVNSAAVVSIMAGLKSEVVASALGICGNIIRVMPNTPSKVGMGATAIAENHCSGESNAFCRKMFESVGSTVYVPEKDFDAVTCVSGSGPAYVFYFIKAMTEGGIANGLSPEAAKSLTLATVAGACKLAEMSDDNLDTLIDKVCSKGGTTIQAIDAFRNANMDKIVIDGMTACRRRSEELGKA